MDSVLKYYCIATAAIRGCVALAFIIMACIGNNHEITLYKIQNPLNPADPNYEKTDSVFKMTLCVGLGAGFSALMMFSVQLWDLFYPQADGKNRQMFLNTCNLTINTLRHICLAAGVMVAVGVRDMYTVGIFSVACGCVRLSLTLIHSSLWSPTPDKIFIVIGTLLNWTMGLILTSFALSAVTFRKDIISNYDAAAATAAFLFIGVFVNTTFQTARAVAINLDWRSFMSTLEDIETYVYDAGALMDLILGCILISGSWDMKWTLKV